MAVLAVLAATCLLGAVEGHDAVSQEAVVVAVSRSLRVSVSVGSASAFRLTVDFGGAAADSRTPLPSPSLDADRAMANFTRVSGPDGIGIRTGFGELVVSSNGRFTLKDAAGTTVAAARAVPTLAEEGSGHAGITMPVSGSKTGPGATGRRPCLVNGGWGPPFTWDPSDKFFAMAVSPWGYDPDYIHCYPVSFPGVGALDPPPLDSCTTITHVVPFGWLLPYKNATTGSFSNELPGSPIKTGESGGDSTDSCCNACNANTGCTAWVHDSNGNLCHLFSCVDQWVPPDAINGSDNRYLSGGLESMCPASELPPEPNDQPTGGYIHQDGWWALGTRADWYLAPTPQGGFDFTKALFDLTGAPAVPPLFGMGFMATYWGYKSMQEVEQYMHQFRQRQLPIDSFIMDYDWFGPESCPLGEDSEPQATLPGGPATAGPPPPPPPPACDTFLSKETCPKPRCTWDGSACAVPQGGTNCGDYGYRNSFWEHQEFKQPDGSVVRTTTPAEIFDHFHSPPLNMHFGGIRKPRTYSNKELSQRNGWLLPPASDVGEGGDINWNFSVPELRDWYTSVHAHFIEDGMDFWWNDEGETSWFTYILWNEAQKRQYTDSKPNQRSFTINRAWQPGMQRFPAIAWTGDGQSCTHQELLRGIQNGAALVACDLTSPDATTLVRQYQSAVFTPIMRVHMMQGTPRFPWFWPAAADPGFDEHQTAFQAALEMRYRFLPFMYALAHRAHREGMPIAHPASYAFPSGSTGAAAAAAAQYMVGSVLIPSDLGLAHTNARPPPLENNSIAHLPGACQHWYRWNTTTTEAGGQTLDETLGLAEMALFVREGALLPLHANVSIQHSADIGGVLELQVYAGADATFVMVEDDGISEDYATKQMTATRTTSWSWNDATRTLSWAVQGSFSAGANLYTSVKPVLFTRGAAGPQHAATRPLTLAGGSVTFK